MTKKHLTVILSIIIFALLYVTGFNNTASVKKDKTTSEKTKESPANILDTAVANPLFKIVPIKYAELSERTLQHIAHFQFDEWADMLPDSMTYSYPNGDAATRTTLHGKSNAIDWWKNWKQTS